MKKQKFSPAFLSALKDMARITRLYSNTDQLSQEDIENLASDETYAQENPPPMQKRHGLRGSNQNNQRASQHNSSYSAGNGSEKGGNRNIENSADHDFGSATNGTNSVNYGQTYLDGAPKNRIARANSTKNGVLSAGHTNRNSMPKSRAKKYDDISEGE